MATPPSAGRHGRATLAVKKLKYLRKRANRRLRLWYRRSLADEGVSVSLDTDVDSKTMLLTFGGMRSTAGIASFEFVALTRAFGVKRMFVRDPRQSWYHRGMPQHGTTLESVGEVLRELLQEHDVERLVTVGNSSGGYAALVFGALLRADVALAFSPQTTLDRALLEQMNDHRWDDMLQPLYDKDALEQRWIDLGAALPGALQPGTRCNVYFDETLDGDRLHAERLAGIEGVRLFRFGRGGHSLARMLRDCGALDYLLRRALAIADAGAPATDSAAPRAQDAELRYRIYR